ncbi:MAG: sulfurtransferase TusA [Pseudomonadota bacterium]
MDFDAELDARGLTCPEPLMLLRHKMRTLAPAQVLMAITTDPSTVRDFQNYCRFVGHELLEQQEGDGEWRFWLRCKPGAAG